MQEEHYWQAVVNRDAGADSKFVYAVHPTGIYCKPSCPARNPRREHVVFFPNSGEAEQAGFRPCRRCRPGEMAMADLHVTIVQQLCHYIEEHSHENSSLAQLSEHVHISPFHLQRVFKHVMGISPRQYREACRLEHFKARLRDGEPVTSALFDVGYGSSSRLYEHAPTQLGMTPKEYRRGGEGMSIHYAITDCPLGRLLVGITERGICAVSLGDTDEELEATLWKEYPKAEIKRDHTENMCEWVRSIVSYLQGQQPHLDLPLDIQSTAFEWRVWKELQAIPYGETRSYGEIAQALGDRKKARAVANACAANPTALIIPCHRIVRSDGDPGEYRWGTERKQRLLAQEQQGQVEQPD
jgi:AraC family transcriptional regulator of adaptative response/methylated-DNA-[protein]-cysteine methyltransferase